MRVLILAFSLMATTSAIQAERAAQEQRIGKMVLEIQEALAHPEEPESIETIAHYGTLTEHYLMIRGWLGLELQGVESQLQATHNSRLKETHQAKAEFLRKAIRRIDLE